MGSERRPAQPAYLLTEGEAVRGEEGGAAGGNRARSEQGGVPLAEVGPRRGAQVGGGRAQSRASRPGVDSHGAHAAVIVIVGHRGGYAPVVAQCDVTAAFQVLGRTGVAGRTQVQVGQEAAHERVALERLGHLDWPRGFFPGGAARGHPFRRPSP